MEIKRNHKAITYSAEKRLLDYIAPKIYKFITADQLSLIALGGAILAGFGYIISQNNFNYLHLTNLGISLHWFGDSLDGRVARLRNENRPKYGHYLDHILDAASLVVIIFGITYSGLTLTTAWVWVVILVLMIMIHAFLKASVTGEFDLSFQRFGPTESRISLVTINFLILTIGNNTINSFPFPATLFDLFGIIASIILFANLLLAVSSTLWGKNKIKEM